MRVTRIPCLTLSRRTLTGLRPWQNQPLRGEGEVMSARSRVPDAIYERLPLVVLYDMTVEACTRLNGSYLTSWRQAAQQTNAAIKTVAETYGGRR